MGISNHISEVLITEPGSGGRINAACKSSQMLVSIYRHRGQTAAGDGQSGRPIEDWSQQAYSKREYQSRC